MTAKPTITPAENAELTQLRADYETASVRAAATLRTGGRPLEGELLRRHRDEEAKVAAIVRRIKEINGTTGKPWSG